MQPNLEGGDDRVSHMLYVETAYMHSGQQAAQQRLAVLMVQSDVVLE
jgi:hypothetical protein